VLVQPRVPLVSLQVVPPLELALPQAPQEQAQVQLVSVQQQRAVPPEPLRVRQQLVRAQALQVLVRVLELARAPPFVQLLPLRLVHRVLPAPPLPQPFQHPQRPSDDVELSLPRRQGWSSNVFSFRLRHNSPAGQ